MLVFKHTCMTLTIEEFFKVEATGRLLWPSVAHVKGNDGAAGSLLKELFQSCDFSSAV